MDHLLGTTTVMSYGDGNERWASATGDDDEQG